MLGRMTANVAVAGAVMLAMSCSSSAPRTQVPASPTAAALHAQIGTWGLDLSARDPAVKPGDDFYRYANGHWLDTNHIPPDRTHWGSFDELEERSQEQLRSLIEALPAVAATIAPLLGPDTSVSFPMNGIPWCSK